MRYKNIEKNNKIKIDKKDWNNIVKEDKNSTIFHLYEWGNILEDIHNQKFICVKEGECILPLSYVRSFIFGNRLISMPFADYGGISGRNVTKKEGERILKKTIKIANNLDIDFIEIRSPNDSYISYFEDNGFIKRHDYVTFRINLAKEKNDLWSSIDSERRTGVRKAIENELVFSEGNNSGVLKEFYKLYLKRMKGIGSPPQPLKYFERLWAEFYPENLKISFVSTKDGEKIATALFLINEDTIYYNYGASSDEHWDLRPNDFLFWNVIERYSEGKFSTLDLGRTRVGSGVYLFKRKWGGQKVKMPYLYYFRKKELKERQEIEYKRFSEFWAKYMPSFLAKMMGPWFIKQIG